MAEATVTKIGVYRHGTRSERLAEARKLATHSKLEWEVLHAIFDGQCARCGSREYRTEKDHVMPLCLGGSDGIENLQPVCARCNAAKGPEAIDWRTKAYPRWREHYNRVAASINERLP